MKARRWVDAGLVDLRFYSALRGREFGSEQEAAEDLVEHGMEARLSPHPLLDVLTLPGEVRRAYRQGKVKAVLEALPDGPAGPLTALFDPGPAVGHLREVAARLGRGQSPESGPVAAEVSGRTSVVVAASSRSVLRTVASVLRQADGDTELVVVDQGLEPPVVLALHAAVCARLDAVPVDQAGSWLWETEAVRVRVAGRDAVVSGDVVLRLADGAEVRRGWAAGLRSQLARPDVGAVQPLVLGPDDLVMAAGVSADGGLLLLGHPSEDATRLDGEVVPAAHPSAIAHRSGEPAAAPVVLSATSRVSLRDHPDGARAAELPTVAGEGLRWSLRLPSPPGGFGDTWGDTYFAESLANALRREGQDVVTRRRGAHDRGPVGLDDVALALRGLHPIPPAPGARNVLWVISHPDEVEPSELEGYDVVCAASAVWSERLSDMTGREVVTLLQASEFTVPDLPAPDPDDASLVFVGTNLGDRERPLVWAAVESGVPLAVYGPGWQGLPAGVWRGEHVPNAELPPLYRRHGIVLADHWPDMARQGFVANRVLDALASGARVISDEVAGLHDVVDAADVAVAETPEQVRAAYDALRLRSGTPLRDATDHGFDDRARRLVALVEGV